LSLDERRRDWACWLVTVFLLPSTSLGYYAFQPMSHVAAFCAGALFLYVWWHAKDTNGVLRWMGAGAAMSLLTLCRWQDILFVAIPLTYEILGLWFSPQGGPRPFFSWGWFRARAMATVTATVVFIPQMLEWRAIYGGYLLNPQRSDYFDFPPQHIDEVLFSSFHGWFIWTPITLVGIIGLLFIGLRAMPRLVGPILVALALEVGLIGSIRFSYHNDTSFSIRMLTTCSSLIAIGLLCLLRYRSTACRIIIGTVCGLCALHTSVLACQYFWGMGPLKGRLTVDEVIWDRIRPIRAFKRQRLFLEATQEWRAGRIDKAAALAEKAEQQYGLNQVLLDLMEDIYRWQNDPQKFEWLEVKKEEVRKRTLY